MKTYTQKPESKWWRTNANYQLYALRESSAVFIALWAIFMVLRVTVQIPYIQTVLEKYDSAFLLCGLFGALVHTITWLALIPKLLPLENKKILYNPFFIILLIIWISLSLLIIYYPWM